MGTQSLTPLITFRKRTDTPQLGAEHSSHAARCMRSNPMLILPTYPLNGQENPPSKIPEVRKNLIQSKIFAATSISDGHNAASALNPIMTLRVEVLKFKKSTGRRSDAFERALTGHRRQFSRVYKLQTAHMFGIPRDSNGFKFSFQRPRTTQASQLIIKSSVVFPKMEFFPSVNFCQKEFFYGQTKFPSIWRELSNTYAPKSKGTTTYR